ncbi:MAG: hypothetical protein ACYDB3_04220 [Acidimicrobiales bacterium]
MALDVMAPARRCPTGSGAPPPGGGGHRRAAPWVTAGALYAALGVVLWWHAWWGGPSSTLATGSGDPAQGVWAMAWVPHALAHGLDPLFSRSLFAPRGVNLVANTSVLLPALVLSPVTVLFGPVAAFTVAVTLAPAASALSAFVALRRYASWAPAAFCAGLLYGFGPFLTTDLRYGHLYLTVLVIPPLMLMSFDRILVQQRGSAVRCGLGLGALVVAQFFVSIEVLVVAMVVAMCALGVLVAALPSHVRARARFATQALGYPTWLYLRGPRHFSGSIWADMGRFATPLGAAVLPHGESPSVGFVSGGNGGYLGAPLVALLIIGLLVWHGDRILRVALAMTGICYVFSLGPVLLIGNRATDIALPSWALEHLPVVSSITDSRFAAFVDLFAAMALAIVVDRVHSGNAGGVGRHRIAGPAARALLAGGTGAVVLLPLYGVATWPYPVRHLSEPAVLRAPVVTALAAGAVVREYPPTSGTDADAMIWQAVTGLRYSLADGYAIVPGPGGRASVEPPDDAVTLVFAAAYLGRLQAPYSASMLSALRLEIWRPHVRAVVVRAGSRGSAAADSVLTAALGPPSTRSTDGWVWTAPGVSR